MNKLKVSVAIILVFILGALAGSLGTQAFMKYRISKFMKRGHEARAESIIERLSHVLGLTDSQKLEIEKITSESLNKLTEIEKEFSPRIQAVMDDSFKRMKEFLNDDQKRKLEVFHDHLKKRKGPGLFPPPPPPPPDKRRREKFNDDSKWGLDEFHDPFLPPPPR